MRRSRFLLGASLAVALTAALAGGAAAVGGKPYSTPMSGAEEAPGPGDPDGSGFASFTVNAGQGVICYSLSVENIDPAVAAHIHIGAVGVPGPVVVPLNPPTSGTSSGCAEGVSRELALDLITNPTAYYVNVHNPAFPAGAVRGQLGD